MKSPRPALAFTLLEAMIALIVLAGVASASLQLRAQSLRGRAGAAEATSRDAALDDLLRQAIAGLLTGEASSAPADGDAPGRLVWRGELDGDPYEISREAALVPNPFAGAGERAAEVWLLRWRASWRGQTVEEWRQP